MLENSHPPKLWRFVARKISQSLSDLWLADWVILVLHLKIRDKLRLIGRWGQAFAV
jgi:hypothetical protein